MGGMAGTGPHLVIGKGDVHAPVQLILHGPMASHGLCQAFCIGTQAAKFVRINQSKQATQRVVGRNAMFQSGCNRA